MNISSLASKVTNKDQGIGLLVDSLLDPNSKSLSPESFEPLIASALESIEKDTQIGAQLADDLATHLCDAQEAFRLGLSPWGALEKLVTCYQNSPRGPKERENVVGFVTWRPRHKAKRRSVRVSPGLTAAAV